MQTVRINTPAGVAYEIEIDARVTISAHENGRKTYVGSMSRVLWQWLESSAEQQLPPPTPNHRVRTYLAPHHFAALYTAMRAEFRTHSQPTVAVLDMTTDARIITSYSGEEKRAILEAHARWKGSQRAFLDNYPHLSADTLRRWLGRAKKRSSKKPSVAPSAPHLRVVK